MNKIQKIELIKKYAPMVWIPEDDAFLPEDCQVMESVAKVGKSSSDMKPFKLDELGKLKNSKKYYLDIPEIDFNNFGLNSDYQGSEMGPEALSAHVREKFGNNPFLNPKARRSMPKYHARVSEISITYIKDRPFSEYYKIHDPGLFGNYQVIQYFFFFIFNDSWNKHLGDWDSTLEMFIKKDKTRAYAILHMHHLTWMVKFNPRPKKLIEWITEWQKVRRNRHMGIVYQFALHPFVFIAKGAHGGYPTPGFSVHGLKPIIQKVIGQTDYRQIGKLCIFPDYPPVTKDAILKILREADIDTSQTNFLSWEEAVILEKQPWLKYKGLWGTKSEYSGWSGPTGPSRKGCWRMDQRRFKKAFKKAMDGDYSGEWILKIFKNWHGWRELS